MRLVTVGTSKANFFDRQAVIAAVGRANAVALRRAGALVRADAQRSIVYAAGSAPAGAPPHGHRTMIKVSKTQRTKAGAFRRQAVSPLRDRVEFAWDFTDKTTIVGAVRLAGKLGDAPHALEHGGSSTIQDHGKKKATHIAPHPFMWPALQRTKHKFAPLWRGQVKAH